MVLSKPQIILSPNLAFAHSFPVLKLGSFSVGSFPVGSSRASLLSSCYQGRALEVPPGWVSTGEIAQPGCSCLTPRSTRTPFFSALTPPFCVVICVFPALPFPGLCKALHSHTRSSSCRGAATAAGPAASGLSALLFHCPAMNACASQRHLLYPQLLHP